MHKSNHMGTGGSQPCDRSSDWQENSQLPVNSPAFQAADTARLRTRAFGKRILSIQLTFLGGGSP